MKQRQLEENLQKREQELNAREIELLGRELNMMMTQSTPTPIKRRGKFKKARLKVLERTLDLLNLLLVFFFVFLVFLQFIKSNNSFLDFFYSRILVFPTWKIAVET